MKIAVPIWQDNVSGVLDFANKLLLVEIENGAETGRNEIILAEQSGPERAANIRQLGVNVVICGAISKSLACALSSSGIKVLPFVTGSTEQILTAYRESKLNLPQYAMSCGCWQDTRNGFGRRRGRCGRNKI
ncbi:MAG: NifB/NifX family molybdenum-iron cluster-binding protein [Phycisphaerae bacterium]|jgi:predicted Fe-Mo cluster-binding NifX family protein